MKEILNDAQQKKYGVGYYNTINLEMVRSCIRAAESENSPIIIGTAQVLLSYSDYSWLAPMLINAASNAKVPVAVHLDHAYNFDVIMKAMQMGFGSVMFDGSSLEYEENVRCSAKIAEIAHSIGVGLECELGKVGGLDEGGGTPEENVYTDPRVAKDFITRTNADFLAVSIGTTHGVYLETPKLDFNRLADIRHNVNEPLVLHGGSGLSNADFKKCIEGGICKINIYTDLITAASECIQNNNEKLAYPDLMKATEDAMYQVVVDKIRLFDSNNKA
jgi:fructose-bisphosphate aldolase class II